MFASECVFEKTKDRDSKSSIVCCIQASVLMCVSNLYLCGQIVTDSVQQCLCGFVSAHQHQLQVHVSFDQEAFGHESDPHHSTEHATAAGLSVFKDKQTPGNGRISCS